MKWCTLMPVSHAAVLAEGTFSGRYSRRESAKNTDRAAYFYGELVGHRMALHYRVSTPRFLEGCPRDRVVAVLSRRPLQPACALITGLFRVIQPLKFGASLTT